MTEKISFKDLNLIAPLAKAVAEKGYEIPTPIQVKAIPVLLAGHDLIGIAQTGTGKTAAFTLPLLQKMKEKYPRVIKTLVVAPTRELAAQIGESFSIYGKFLPFRHTVIFGGVGQERQIRALKAGMDILVATPGRLLDLMNQKKLNLDNVEFFVLDEADRMLDMGFLPDIKKIIARLPKKRQSLFFSATMSPTVNTLAESLLTNPVRVEVAAQSTPIERIKQYMFFVDQTEKLDLLLELLKHERLTSILIFTRTKHRADKVSGFLNKNKIAADSIHGSKSQNARVRAIQDFKSGKTKVLVATDIAARGIDIPDISHVINFELPNEAENYVHRIGRTARAGTDGTAFSFCAAEEREYLRDIEKLIKQKIEVMDHDFHSETAKNATGSAAKPPARGRRSFANRTNDSDRGRNSFRERGANSGRSESRSRRPFRRSRSSYSQNRQSRQQRDSR